MSHAFPTSPSASGEQRKFINPTPGYVGANVFGPDGKPTSRAVEPGGEVWLTPEEERMTAEAPRLAQDNPFVKEWDEPVEWNSFGEVERTVSRRGILVLSDEPARPVASDRFIPDAAGEVGPAVDARDAEIARLRAELAAARAEPVEEETVKGADVPRPSQPAPQGQPSPNEIVGTPDAVAANDSAVAQRKPTREQPTKAIPVG